MTRIDTLRTDLVKLDCGEERWIEIKQDLSLEDTRQARAFVAPGEGLILGLLAVSIVSWNLRDSEDRPVEFSLDAFRNAIPNRIVADMVTAFSEWLSAQIEKKKGPAARPSKRSRPPKGSGSNPI